MNISLRNLIIAIAVLVGIAVAFFFYQAKKYSAVIDGLESRNSEMVSKYKGEKVMIIDSLKSIQENTVKELDKEIVSLKEYNKILTSKLKNYGKNPSFNDYDFIERAKHVSEYKYQSGEQNAND